MTENSFIYTSVDGDRVVKADDIREMLSLLISNGVYQDPATNLKVYKSTGDMEVEVQTGYAWINGGFYTLSEKGTYTVPTASGTAPRIDTVVLRYTASGRSIKLQYVEGTAASLPQATAPERNDNTYELVLCEIYVKAGATAITDANITDKRNDNDVCGYVTGAIDQITTTDLFNQFTSAFETWFDGVKNTLGDDSAGNLLELINANTTALEETNENITNMAVNADVIRAKMSTDYVPSSEVVSLPFNTAYNNGVLSTDWGEVQDDGSVKILRAGEYQIGVNVFISDANGIDFFHVRTKNRATDITIGENYVARDGKLCSGNAFNQTYLAKGEIVSVHIFPAILTRSYRISQKQTHLTVAPIHFD